MPLMIIIKFQKPFELWRKFKTLECYSVLQSSKYDKSFKRRALLTPISSQPMTDSGHVTGLSNDDECNIWGLPY